MIIELSLLKERVEFITAVFGDQVKVSGADNKEFVVVEFDINGSTELLNLFHAGFRCGYETHRKVTEHLF
jgi:hypothetical protein